MPRGGTTWCESPAGANSTRFLAVCCAQESLTPAHFVFRLYDLRKKPVDHAVDHACDRPVDDDRPRDGEHLDRCSGDEALCLCQDRDEGNFCPILLGFWLLKFLKKSAFFAKLL